MLCPPLDLDPIIRTMNIAIIGTINRDTIYPFKGPKIESYGGILYNIMALASLLTDQTALFPICNLGHDVQRPVFNRLDHFPNIDRRGIHIVPHLNNHAILRYTSPTQGKEYLQNRVPPLTFNQVAFSLDCDFILINFISGFDLSLETLRQIREKYTGNIYIDIHNLTSDVAKNGSRSLKYPAHWAEWVENCDIVQFNQDEAQILADQELSSYGDLSHFAQRVYDIGPEVILITLGKEGSIIAYGDDGGVTVDHCRGCETPVIDPTGCGDVFSAGFITEFIRSEDPVRANRFANRIAGMNCAVHGVEGLYTIGDRISRQRR